MRYGQEEWGGVGRTERVMQCWAEMHGRERERKRVGVGVHSI